MVAGRHATELIMEVRYSLRMLGVPIDGPVVLLGDNMSVILSTTIPSSVLKKKHVSCSYHRIREAIAANILRFSHITSDRNYADIMTKPVSRETFYQLTKGTLFRVPRESKGHAV